MKFLNKNTLLYITSIGMILSGCDSTKRMSKQDKGVIVGATGGAVIGGVIGNNVGKKGNTVLGAIIGATVGGIAGGIIGNKMDRQAQKIKTEIPGAKVERVGEGINVTFDENNPDGSKAGVYFATDKSDISPNSKLALEKLVKIFNEYPETNILIEGHTDDVGKENYNMKLSKQRAESVVAYLKNQGIAAARLSFKYYGEGQPKVENNSDANRSLNRRVEFAITANEKMKADAKKEADKM